jgi:hypothetical protein
MKFLVDTNILSEQNLAQSTRGAMDRDHEADSEDRAGDPRRFCAFSRSDASQLSPWSAEIGHSS